MSQISLSHAAVPMETGPKSFGWLLIKVFVCPFSCNVPEEGNPIRGCWSRGHTAWGWHGILLPFLTGDGNDEICPRLQQGPTLQSHSVQPRDRLETWSHTLSPWCLEGSSGISLAGVWDDEVFASRGESFPWGHPQTCCNVFRRRKCSAFGLDSLLVSLKSTHQTCRHTHARLVVSAASAFAIPANPITKQTQLPNCLISRVMGYVWEITSSARKGL